MTQRTDASATVHQDGRAPAPEPVFLELGGPDHDSPPTLTPPASGAIFVRAEVRHSGVAGKGLFAAEPVRRGTVVGCFTLGSAVATEEEYVRACAEQRNPLMRTGTRYVGRYFTYGNEAAPYTYM